MAASKCSTNSFPMAVNFDSNLITALWKKLMHVLKLKPPYREGNDEFRKIIQNYGKNLRCGDSPLSQIGACHK